MIKTTKAYRVLRAAAQDPVRDEHKIAMYKAAVLSNRSDLVLALQVRATHARASSLPMGHTSLGHLKQWSWDGRAMVVRWSMVARWSHDGRTISVR
jgi:hypothetical protein